MGWTAGRSAGLAEIEPGAEYQVWPPGMDVRTRLSIDRLINLLWQELGELRFTRPDDPGLLARRDRLAAAFRAAAPWDADELWARLALPRRDDPLARLFHHRLATPTRRFLLGILASKPHQQLEAEFEYEADEDPRLAHEAGRRALREALANADRDCSGPPLRRLRRTPLNRGAESLRLQRQLDEARASGSASRMAKAQCELSAFRWDAWNEPFRSRKLDAYRELTRAVQSAQQQAERERWLLTRWKCRTWPLTTPMPATVRAGCDRQQRRADAADAALAALEPRRVAMEDDILLGR